MIGMNGMIEFILSNPLLFLISFTLIICLLEIDNNGFLPLLLVIIISVKVLKFRDPVSIGLIAGMTLTSVLIIIKTLVDYYRNRNKEVKQ